MANCPISNDVSIKFVIKRSKPLFSIFPKLFKLFHIPFPTSSLIDDIEIFFALMFISGVHFLNITKFDIPNIKDDTIVPRDTYHTYLFDNENSNISINASAMYESPLNIFTLSNWFFIYALEEKTLNDVVIQNVTPDNTNNSFTC